MLLPKLMMEKCPQLVVGTGQRVMVGQAREILEEAFDQGPKAFAGNGSGSKPPVEPPHIPEPSKTSKPEDNASTLTEYVDDLSKKDSLANKIKDVRRQMPNNPLKMKGNMAIADVDIPGLKKEFIAHSKINAPTDKGADVGDFSMLKSDKDRIFTTYEPASSTLIGPKYDRYHDTEAKILEDIASQIKQYNISGSVNLYTELDACQSCTNIIFEFKRMFPNIKLNIFSGK